MSPWLTLHQINFYPTPFVVKGGFFRVLIYQMIFSLAIITLSWRIQTNQIQQLNSNDLASKYAKVRC